MSKKFQNATKRYCIHHNSLLKHQQNFWKQNNANPNLPKKLSRGALAMYGSNHFFYKNISPGSRNNKGVQTTLYSMWNSSSSNNNNNNNNNKSTNPK